MADEKTDKDTTPPDDKGTEGGDDKGTGTEDAWMPPTKEEWERSERARIKAIDEAKERKEKVRELQQQTEDATSKAAREQAEAAERKFKPVAIRAAAKAAFLEAGLQGGSPELIGRLVRSLDLDAITVDDDGDVIGLDEQVAALKAEAPQLFDPKEKRPPRVDGSDKQGTNGRAKTASQLQAEQIWGVR